MSYTVHQRVRTQYKELDRSTLDIVIMGCFLGSLTASTEVAKLSSLRAPKEKDID